MGFQPQKVADIIWELSHRLSDALEPDFDRTKITAKGKKQLNDLYSAASEAINSLEKTKALPGEWLLEVYVNGANMGNLNVTNAFNINLVDNTTFDIMKSMRVAVIQEQNDE